MKDGGFRLRPRVRLGASAGEEGLVMKDITLEELLVAGCHFGHQVTRQNPKAREFVYEARDGVHIIDLVKTKEGLDEAAAFVKTLASQNKSLIVVGTKRQAQAIIKEEVKRAQEVVPTENLLHVTTRWIGGTLTNFGEVTKNFKKLKDLAAKLVDEREKAQYTKREVGLWERERQKLEAFYGGIAALQKIPDALLIVDTHLEDLAVREAMRMGVATIGIVDTNADPFVIDYPIPANDDAVGSIQLIVGHIIDAWIEGSLKQNAKQEKTEEKKVKKPVAKPKKESKSKKKSA